jgi:aromatic ring-cleaving dioxygenase
MAEPFADPERIDAYHAHIYYDPADPESRARAERVRQGVGERFSARLGNWHDEPVGPHPVAMYQVAFAADEFPRLAPWLMLNRDELDVLIHPLSGDSVADHTRFAMWLGHVLPLRTDVLRRGSGA